MEEREEEEAAIDIIYSIPDKIKILEAKIDNLTAIVKLLYSKSCPPVESPMPITQSSVKMVAGNKPTENKEPSKLIIGKTKVFGKIITGSGKPVRDASIKIFTKNEKVKDVLSDSNGYWEVRLPNGDFNAIIYLNGKEVLKRNFQIKDEKEIELKW